MNVRRQGYAGTRGCGVNCLTQCEATHLHNGHNVRDLTRVINGRGNVSRFV